MLDNVNSFTLVENLQDNDKLSFYSAKNKYSGQAIRMDKLKDYIRGYSCFVATFIQTTTGAPVFTVIENGLGAYSSGYTDVGEYLLTFSEGLTAGKTAVFLSNGVAATSKFLISNYILDVAAGTVGIYSYNQNAISNAYEPTDDLFTNATIEVRVYF